MTDEPNEQRESSQIEEASETHDVVRDAIARLPFFPPLKDAGVEVMKDKLQLVRFAKDTLIFAEGDPGDFFYIILSGKVKVMIGGDKPRQIATLERDDCFGEMALLTGEPRTATVVAAEDTEVLALNKADFDQLLAVDPALAVNLSKMLGRRLMHQRALAEEAEQESGEKYLAVFYSPTGRVGRTTLALNAAALLHQAGKKVVFVDLDLQFGSAGLLLNVKPSLTIFDLAQKKEIEPELFETHLTKTEAGFPLLLAPLRIEQAELVEEEKIQKILAHCLETYDVTIVDTNTSLNTATLAALDMASRIFFVFQPDLIGLKNAKACVEVMKTLQYPPEKITLVRSLVGSPDQGTSVEKIPQILGFSVAFDLVDDKAVDATVKKGSLLALENPKSPGVGGAHQAAAFFLAQGEEAPKEASAKFSLLRGLLGKRS